MFGASYSSVQMGHHKKDKEGGSKGGGEQKDAKILLEDHGLVGYTAKADASYATHKIRSKTRTSVLLNKKQ